MSSQVSYIFQAVDRFSNVANSINEKMEKIEHAASRTATKFKNLGQTTRRVGEEMVVFLDVPIAFLTKEAVQEYGRAADALAQVNLTLKNTHEAAGFTSEQLQKMDEQLSKTSLYSKTDILSGVTKNLLRFKDLHGEAFKKAQQDIVNYAASTGVSLKAATKVIGIALSDPSQGFVGLRRVGIMFTEQQKKMLAQLVKTNHVATAQRYIFQRLALMQGAATTAMKSGTGPIKNLHKNLEELQESFGHIISVGLAPFIQDLTRLIEWLRKLSPHTKKLIVEFALGISVFSIVITYLGVMSLAFASLIETVTLLSRAVLFLVSPMGLGIAAFAVFVYEMYRAIQKGNTLVFVLTDFGAAIATVFIALRVGLGPISWIIGLTQVLAMALVFAYKNSARFRHAIGDLVTELKIWGNEILYVWGLLEKFGGAALRIAEKLFGGSNKSLSINSNQSVSHALSGSNMSHVAVTLDVNDRNNIIKSATAKKTGSATFNLGKNMSLVG